MEGSYIERVALGTRQRSLTSPATRYCAHLTTYGRRSMGDQRRFTPDGPRELNESDYRTGNSDSPPKVVANPVSEHIVAEATFEPVVNVDEHLRLIAKLDARAGTQRGKPHSRAAGKNPLGGRIFDMNCGWPMYRVPDGEQFDYRCGAYMQSHGALCKHNPVDGPTATRITLSCLRQTLLLPPMLTKLLVRLQEIAESERVGSGSLDSVKAAEARLRSIQREMDLVQSNMARAETAEQFKAISAEFDKLSSCRRGLESELAAAKSNTDSSASIDDEVAAAIKVLDRLAELSGDDGLENAGEIFRLTNARLFLAFTPTQVKKRVLNKVTAGIVTLGAAPPPVELYSGPTARNKVARQSEIADTNDLTSGNHAKSNLLEQVASLNSGVRRNSLGNVNRGDRI